MVGACDAAEQALHVYAQVTREAVSVPPVVPDISAAVGACSVIVGITTSLILFCSHFHQIADDTAAKKLSPLVKLGTAKGVKVTCPGIALWRQRDPGTMPAM